MEHNRYNPSEGETQSRPKFVIADITESAEAKAQDAALARLTEKPETDMPKGWKKLFSGKFWKTVGNQIWKQNLARDYYETKYKKEEERKIKQSGNLFAGEEKFQLVDEKGKPLSAEEQARRKQAAEEADKITKRAITSRFAQAEGELVEDLVHSEMGEKIDKLGNSESEQEFKRRMQGLIKAYARNSMSDEEFSRYKNEILSTLKQAKPNAVGKGQVYADNLLDVAKWAKTEVERQVAQNIDHNQAVINLDLDFDVVIGQARTGAKTEAQFNAVEKVVDKIQSHTGGLFNETVLTAVVSAAYFAKRSLFTAGAKSMAGFGAGIAASGAVAAVREGRALEKERAQHAREMAEGRSFNESTAKRRMELEKFRLKTKGAEELETDLQSKLFHKLENGRDISSFSEAEYQEALKSVVEIDARILESERGVFTRQKKWWQVFRKAGERRRADLISYSNPTTIAEQEQHLDLARATAKIQLKKWALAHGKTAEQFKADLQAAVEGNIASFYQGDEGIQALNKKFSEFKHHEMWVKAKRAMVIGAALGVAIQEATALSSSNSYGLVEHGWDAVRGHHHVFQPGEHATVLEKGFEDGQKSWEHFFPTVHAAESAHETIIGAAKYHLDNGISIQPDAAHPSDYYILDQHGNHISSALHLKPDGSLDDQSVKWLQDHHFGFNEHMTGGGESGIHHLDAAQTHEKYPALDRHPRVDWHDEPGKYWSQVHKMWLEYEGKQQMGFLVKKGDTVFLDNRAVIHNFEQEIRERLNDPNFGQVEGWTNQDGTTFVDPGMAHLKQQILEAINNHELAKHFQAVVIPTDGANHEGLSDLIQAQDNSGLIALKGHYDWSAMFKTAGQVHDKHLPFRFLEQRFDGHVINTSQGAGEVVPATPVIEIIPPPPVDAPIEIPPIFYAGRRRGLEEAGWNPADPFSVATGYYGGYEQRKREAELADFYRQRMSPRLRSNPEAQLDFQQEADWYLAEMMRRDSDYARDLISILRQPDMRVAVSNECRAVSCIPVYDLGEGKVIEHALDQYRKQIDNDSVKPEEFEIILFLNHPQNKLEQLTKELADQGKSFDGAEQRVRNGQPEAYDTAEVVKQYKEKYPYMNIRVMEKEFDQRPKWGWIIKYLYDAACIRLKQRTNPHNKDGLILTNDVDVRDMADKYLRSIIDDADKNEVKAANGEAIKLDGFVGRIDHDNETYKKWPNFFLATRFDQFLDAQNRFGYEGIQPPYVAEADNGYMGYVKRSGEKHIITQGRNTILRASAYCAIGGANFETDAGADTELGGIIRVGRRGVEDVLKPNRNPFGYENKAWLETDPRRELGMYKKGQPVAWAWAEWDQMNVYGKSFEEQIQGDSEDIDPSRLEKEFFEILKKWNEGPNSPVVRRALHWLGLKDSDYSVLNGQIKINSIDNLTQLVNAWKPKRERLEIAAEKSLPSKFEADPFSFIYGDAGQEFQQKGLNPSKLVKNLFSHYGFTDADINQAIDDARFMRERSSLTRRTMSQLVLRLADRDPSLLTNFRSTNPQEYNKWAVAVNEHNLAQAIDGGYLNNQRINEMSNKFGLESVQIIQTALSTKPGWKKRMNSELAKLGAGATQVKREATLRQVLRDVQRNIGPTPRRRAAPFRP